MSMIADLLRQVQKEEISTEEAEERIRNFYYQDLGFVKPDHSRSLRSGFGEVIYCEGKRPEHLTQIFAHFAENERNVLGTRAWEDQYEQVLASVPDVTYDPVSRMLRLIRSTPAAVGCIAVCTGGTSDIPVAEEAAQTAEFFGSKVERFYDVGVAGIHRLLINAERIRQANCIVAIAGMEGALPGVIAGLADKPVIAVPTSVGYGAHFNGLAPLLTMLNSCAEGIAVVNIDNGFGAGYMATQINRLAVSGTTHFSE